MREFIKRIKQAAINGVFALKLAWHAGPFLLIGLLLLILLQACLPALELALTKLVIDRAAFDLAGIGSPHSLALALPLGVWIILAVLTIVLGYFIQPFTATLEGLAGDRTGGYTTERIIAATSRWQGLEYFEDARFLNDLHIARDRAARSGVSLLMYGGRMVIEVFTALSLMVVLGALHPLIPLVLLLASAPSMALMWEYGDRTGSHLYIQTADSRRLEYYRDTMLTPEPAKDVRLYNLGGFFSQKYTASFTRAVAALDRL